MLHGDKVTLRGRLEADIPILEAELFEDVEGFSRSAGAAWRPLWVGERSLYGKGEPNERLAVFSVVDRATTELVGSTLLWGIDTHNRHAHLGIAMLPAARGKGYGTDTIEVLCAYAFTTLGLHRLQLETLVDNVGMLTSAERCGFVREAHHRESSWVNGEFMDDVALGLLASEWRARRAAAAH